MSHLSKIVFCAIFTYESNNYGFSNCDINFSYEKILYLSNSLIIRPIIHQEKELLKDYNFEFAINHEVFDQFIGDEKNLLKGNFEIFLLDMAQTSPSKKILRKGSIEKYQNNDGIILASLCEFPSSMNKSLVQSYSASCRANLGDDKCKVKLRTIKSKITKIQGDLLYLDRKIDHETEYFLGGYAENENHRSSIIEFTGSQVKLSCNKFNPGDEIFLIPSCNLTLSDCTKKFNNALNFRGEPFIPTITKIVKG